MPVAGASAASAPFRREWSRGSLRRWRCFWSHESSASGARRAANERPPRRARGGGAPRRRGGRRLRVRRGLRGPHRHTAPRAGLRPRPHSACGGGHPRRQVPGPTGDRDRGATGFHRSRGPIAGRARGEGAPPRRRLLGTAAGAAGAAMGAAIVVPLASLGPSVDDRLRESPWRDGVPLVDENGIAVPASHLDTGSFLSAFAKGADRERLASSLVVVRVNPDDLALPDERADWAPEGIMAFSKICTHAGCAINLYRSPLYPPRSPGGPALVCPCHYSTFDVLTGGDVIFGPAGRPLPQLPLRIDSGGNLVAAGPLSGNVGPSWSGVRQS